MINRINMLFFGDEREASTSDIITYTVGATILLVMIYLKVF